MRVLAFTLMFLVLPQSNAMAKVVCPQDSDFPVADGLPATCMYLEDTQDPDYINPDEVILDSSNQGLMDNILKHTLGGK